MKSLQMNQHIDALRTIAALASRSSDIDMRSKAATLNWLAKEFEAALEIKDRSLIQSGLEKFLRGEMQTEAETDAIDRVIISAAIAP